MFGEQLAEEFIGAVAGLSLQHREATTTDDITRLFSGRPHDGATVVTPVMEGDEMAVRALEMRILLRTLESVSDTCSHVLHEQVLTFLMAQLTSRVAVEVPLVSAQTRRRLPRAVNLVFRLSPAMLSAIKVFALSCSDSYNF